MIGNRVGCGWSIGYQADDISSCRICYCLKYISSHTISLIMCYHSVANICANDRLHKFIFQALVSRFKVKAIVYELFRNSG